MVGESGLACHYVNVIVLEEERLYLMRFGEDGLDGEEKEGTIGRRRRLGPNSFLISLEP